MQRTNKDRHYIIAIDGVSGSGKSTTARLAAEKLGILYLDTGAMYRAVTFVCQEAGIPASDHPGVSKIADSLSIDFDSAGSIIVNGRNLTKEIRDPEVSSQVSDYCAIEKVRSCMARQQREIGRSRSSVLEGRDIGTVVFPDAEFKFYLWASPEIRARRRLAELQQSGVPATLEQVFQNLRERDHKDSTRLHSPLRQAADAVLIDTTALEISDQVRKIVEKVASAYPESLAAVSG